MDMESGPEDSRLEGKGEPDGMAAYRWAGLRLVADFRAADEFAVSELDRSIDTDTDQSAEGSGNTK